MSAFMLSTAPPIPTTSPTSPTPADLVAAFKQAWRDGESPDAAGAVREHPTLLKHRSLFVDLAYEEYCLREDAGRAPEPESFCRDLPAFRSDVREVIRGHRVLFDHPELFDRVDVRWPEPGEVFEGFTVVRELGRGAFARAYLAEDPDTGNRPVVLKLSPTASAEARTLGPVRHAHVADVLWARRANGLSTICMRYVGAATLRDVEAAAFGPAADRPPKARTLLEAIRTVEDGLPSADSVPPVVRTGGTYTDAIAAVAARLAGALAHLHAKGVTHGDLKPSNIVLGTGGHPYLIDFNLAGGADDSLHRCGGTLPYMAPERIRQILGKSSDPVPADRADVYSFGAVLFEALTGRVPFEPIEGPDLKEVAADMLRRQLAEVPRITGVSVPGSLVRLVGQCLAVDPARRPTAEELRRALDRHLGRRAGRVRWTSVAVGLSLVATVGVWFAAQPVPEAHVAVEARPTTPDGLIERGLRVLPTDPAAAERDFGDAYDLRRDERTAALLGLCRSKAEDHRAAVSWYQMAIQGSKIQPAWVHNNLAYGLLQTAGKSKEVHQQAMIAASEALRQERGLRAAHYNRAWARYRAYLDTKNKTFPEAQFPDMEKDLRVVLSGRPLVPDMYYLAALVYAASAAGEPGRADVAVHFLHEAVTQGMPAGPFADDLIFRAHLAGRADFDAVLRLPPGGQDPALEMTRAHLIDPYPR